MNITNYDIHGGAAVGPTLARSRWSRALIIVYIIIITACLRVVITGGKRLPRTETNPVRSAVHIEICRLSENGYVYSSGIDFFHVGVCQDWGDRYGALLLTGQKDINIIRGIRNDNPLNTNNMWTIGVGIDKTWGVVARDLFNDKARIRTFGWGFSSVRDANNILQGFMYFNFLLDNGHIQPCSSLSTHHKQLIPQYIQSDAGRKQTEGKEKSRSNCVPPRPKKSTLVIFFLTCLCFLVIGLYLLCKAGDLVGKISERRANLLAYGGYALSQIIPLATVLWLAWRILVYHGSFLFNL
jgi:hypothetical protein